MEQKQRLLRPPHNTVAIVRAGQKMNYSRHARLITIMNTTWKSHYKECKYLPLLQTAGTRTPSRAKNNSKAQKVQKEPGQKAIKHIETHYTQLSVCNVNSLFIMDLIEL